MSLPTMYKFVLLTCLCSSVLTSSNSADVKNLVGEPDYRKVRLHWETDSKVGGDGFQVRYCEVQSWGPQRCKTQIVEKAEDNDLEDFRTYNADIGGLRMATTYSFEVKNKELGNREDRADGDDKNLNVIVIPTKGFSAKATQCLPHASEIEVSTGPHFGGKITVEAADGERCAVDGEPHSQRDTYTLRINHEECGSQVNDTTVATFVLVQENLPILTHSTRRFLVLCTYQPETLTVRAGINLPTNRRGFGQANVEETGKQGRSMRRGRLLIKPEALVDQEQDKREKEDSNIVPIAIIAILMVAVIAGFIAIIVKWNMRKMREDGDDVSISSEMSTASCSTIADVDIVNERRR
ncbi:PREDICTED: uncharacterized protein LOC108563847 [Nicrophorus vespilloides]|uniref:Uncharacterized protein LOC108563847 n=1 Tax=Nicrophorus vespilloides TaxID=110193 RepID=A0ABM1MU83_NICVS|nr:PREDICTED: uncharacterized protein LOC108563847 [Nicrophorus vespilloides]